MADPVSYVNPERDIEQALLALKKGTSLIKYSRKGKPKLCPFRLSTDETTLIWFSRKEERNLKLASVSQIIPGQRTAVFRRYFCPEKDYLSFSLIYNNGDRSLDLICKDKAEAEVWFAGLKALVSTSKHRISRIEGRSGRFSDDSGSSTHSGRPSFSASLEFASNISRGSERKSSVDFSFPDSSLSFLRSDVGPDRANMIRPSNGDGFRISVSSAPSSSSQGSGPDDCESLGDVYVWGEVWCDNPDATTSVVCSKTDVLLPKALESNVVLDVSQISCGVKHSALVTRQGEVFTWGEESGGRLGLGTEVDISRPQLVELLASCNVEYIACGEYHTCAVSGSGDLFTWGDGSYKSGLLGHGTDVSHWVPKRVSGPLEGVTVVSVACGTWHSALITNTAKLYTFGDGAFGVLGHGNRESISYPREVEALSGLKTIKVACGLWHTAAIVDIGQVASHVHSQKLFTWGDGDKYRLGHGDKEARLAPTCVPSLIDYNFHQIACGHAITIGLSTSGHVFTMGSNAFGQLGNIHSDGKLPCLVQDRLSNELVEDIACGACHVAVLTSRNEVFTWGNGANGRLGHGDTEGRKTPTLVEALKDRHVKSISCGSHFTASVCIHKWVSGADQSVCSGCRQAFGFTRKRHNCYNCGLVHCHNCSSKKVLRAALAPTPSKPHRVCDNCYAKLKAAESGNSSNVTRKNVPPRHSVDASVKLERGEVRYSRSLFSPLMEPVKYIEIKAARQGMRSDHYLQTRNSQALAQLKEISFPSPLGALQSTLKPIITSAPPSNSKSASPLSRKSSPLNGTPARGSIENLKKTNDLLNQEVLNLQAQVKSLRHRHDAERQKYEKKAQDASSIAVEESSRCNNAIETVKSLAEQIKELVEKLPPEANDDLLAMQSQAEAWLKSNENRPSGFCSAEICNSSTESTQLNEVSLADDCRLENTGDADNSRSSSSQNLENGSKSPKDSKAKCGQDREFTEQFEPGVYITFARLPDGTKVFKRIRFSKRKFAEQQAEDWWKENQDRVHKKFGKHNE